MKERPDISPVVYWRADSQAARGFTLVELLVVIAIIALLIGILIPALGTANKMGQRTVCMAHLRGAGQAMIIYANSNNDFLAGPNTSGSKLNGNQLVNANTSDAPIQNFDWISPTLAGSLTLSSDPNQRLADIFKIKLRCPSNREVYTGGAFGGLTVPANALPLPIGSYSAITNFLVNPDSTWNSVPVVNGNKDIFMESWVAKVVSVPLTYAPKLSSVGDATRKIAALDGTRYVDQTTGVETYNSAAKQIEGGNFSVIGPSMSYVVSNGEPYRRDTSALLKISRRFAYRHVGDTLNAVFYDGHAQNLTAKQSTRVDMHFPTGSKVVDPTQLAPSDTTFAKNAILP